MHLLSVEKGTQSAAAITVSSGSDKLRAVIKGLTSSLALHSGILQRLTTLTNGAGF